ncbi:hypothetical protein SAMN02745116_02381 [Pilibacter termitis]|uniref:Uncharacterized protein n=1 Tax=Pilibacter termitis TaxID=263852 RepID=A0A1T4QZU5_9ENTE|nr:hypothetical protein [Pilibacter termitis]SKA09127.1 hypothetical protein SAMN02745116_02381 [Pilibacter termitis]
MKTKEFLATTKGKAIVGAVITLALVAGALTFKVQSDHAQDEKAKTSLKQEIKETKTLLSKARALFDEKQEFLRKDLKTEQVEKVKEELQKNEKEVKSFDEQKYKDLFNDFSTADKEVFALVETAEKMLDTQEKVNALFTKPILNGAEVQKEQILAKKAMDEQIKVLETGSKEKTPFTDKIAEIVKNARTQFTDIDNAKKAIAESEKDKTNENKATNAQKAIDKIKNPDVKKELQTKLDPIKKAIADKKKADEEKRKAEEKKKAEEKGAVVAQDEQQAQEQANQSGQPVYNENTGEYVQPTAQANSGGTSPNNSNNTGGSQGGGQAQSPSTPAPSQPQAPAPQPQQPATPAPQPSKPQTPSGPPAGWINPPYPIGSGKLMDWIIDNGYSGYDDDGTYIRPY